MFLVTVDLVMKNHAIESKKEASYAIDYRFWNLFLQSVKVNILLPAHQTTACIKTPPDQEEKG